MEETIITISIPDKYANMLYKMSKKYESSICDLIKEAIREYYKDDLEYERQCTVAGANVKSYEESY